MLIFPEVKKMYGDGHNRTNLDWDLYNVTAVVGEATLTNCLMLCARVTLSLRWAFIARFCNAALTNLACFSSCESKIKPNFAYLIHFIITGLASPNDKGTYSDRFMECF